MEITEVRVFLKEGQDKKLKAYATLTFDKAFVVRNVKVIEGNKGLFVAMPSRRLKDSCPKCNFKNVLRSKYCNQCGASLPQTEHKPAVAADDATRMPEHKDIAHPITAEFRQYIQKKVLEAFDAEKKRGPSAVKPSSGAAQGPAHDAAHGAVHAPHAEEENDIEL